MEFDHVYITIHELIKQIIEQISPERSPTYVSVRKNHIRHRTHLIIAILETTKLYSLSNNWNHMRFLEMSSMMSLQTFHISDDIWRGLKMSI